MKFKKQNIPNYLTVSRILLFPIIIFFIFFKISSINISYKINDFDIYIPTNMWIAGILFVIASLTDMIDGYLARKYNWVSTFGKIWDPIADKVLINSVLISFSILEVVPFYVTIIMITRDIIVDAYRMVAVKNNIEISANIFGKLKTIFQMIGILIIFFVCQNEHQGLINKNWQYYIIQNLMIFIALLMSIYSGIMYIISFNKELKQINK